MELNLNFCITSLMLGAGLAMDAFSVSLANGLHEPQMKPHRMTVMAAVFGGFQAAMPLIGWFCVRTIADRFAAIQDFIPWIALILMTLIGGKMLFEGLRDSGIIAGCGDCSAIEAGSLEVVKQIPATGMGALLLQAVATSIDALSTGFTMAQYSLPLAVLCAAIICAVTFCFCIAGLIIGRRFGTRFGSGASIFGGIILIIIGIKVFFA